MRIAVSGSHSTGKSTLIAAFLDRCPRYLHEAEAFESLADHVDILSFSEGPTPEGLQQLLEHTISTLGLHGPGASVIFERSPVDYLAYAAAGGPSWPRRAVEAFLETFVPRVRDSLRHLELIVFVPVSPDGVQPRSGESPLFRRRVDEALRRALVDDDYDLFGEAGSPRVVELPSSPERQLSELIRLGSVVHRV